MTLPLLAAKLIQSFEGCKLMAYWDPTGQTWTIGFGHTKNVISYDKITLEEAVRFFEQDSAPLIALVKDRPLIEAAALVSFGYNCGIGALKRVLSGSIHIDHEEFMAGDSSYGDTSRGVRLAGLFARRQLEAALIESSRGLQDVAARAV